MSSLYFWLVILFWSEHTIFAYVIQIFKRLPVVGQLYEYVYPTLTILLLLCSIPYLSKSIKATDLLFYLVCACVVLGTSLLMPENAKYIDERLYKILVIGIPMYFVGVGYDHERIKKALYYASLIGVFVTVLYKGHQLLSGVTLHSDDMYASYNVLPSVMYLLYWTFETPSIWSVLTALIGCFLSFAFGTRGPALAIVLFVSLALFFRAIRSKSFWVKAVFLVSVGIALCLVLNRVFFIGLMEFLAEMFGGIGLSTRIFDMVIGGTVAEDSARDMLSATVIKAIKENPVFGYGLMGDRVILGRYVHNIYVEILCDFGVFLGSGLLIALFAKYFKALKNHAHNKNFFFLLAMIVMIVVKLSLSGSFVYDQFFYFILGICVAYGRKHTPDETNKLC